MNYKIILKIYKDTIVLCLHMIFHILQSAFLYQLILCICWQCYIMLVLHVFIIYFGLFKHIFLRYSSDQLKRVGRTNKRLRQVNILKGGHRTYGGGRNLNMKKSIYVIPLSCHQIPKSRGINFSNLSTISSVYSSPIYHLLDLQF